MELYRNNKSLDNMDYTKVKDITKSDILVGAYEFLNINGWNKNFLSGNMFILSESIAN